MRRREVLQRLLDRTGAEAYLEIGVSKGRTFFPLRVASKVGVEPHRTVPWRRRLRHWARNRRSHVLRMTSDEFFAQAEELLPRLLGGRRPQLAFIDGLHSHEQALRDALSCLELMGGGGIVVMHDCSPPSAAAALPAASREEAAAAEAPGWDGAWCGDVWKAVVQLRALHPTLSCFVLDCDYGLGVVYRGRPEAPLDLSPDEIVRLDYQDLDADRARLLNLKPPEHLEVFLDALPG
jgi:Methyltransferase domain